MVSDRLNTFGTIKFALLAVIAAFAIATVYTSRTIGDRQEALQNTNRYDSAWLASQASSEVARFMERLGSSEVPESGIDGAEIRLRFDILLNRLRVLRNGEFRAFTDTDPRRGEAVDALAAALAAGETLVGSAEDPAARQQLRALFRPLESKLSLLAADAYRSSAERAAEDREGLLQLHSTFTWLAVGLICCGLAFLGLVLWHNRLLSKTQRQLRELTGSLRHTSGQLNAALDNMGQGLCMVDADGHLTVFNARFLSILGLPSGSVAEGDGFTATLGRSPLVEGAGGLFRPDRPWPSTLNLRNRRVLAVARQPLQEGGCVATFEDITNRREAEAKIEHMAHHDALTDLPNRVAFLGRLEAALASLESGQSLAILSLDLDRFKTVNDSLGHPIGDELLRAVAKRLQGCVRRGDTVARFGGDEFIILQTGPQQQSGDSEGLARRILDVVGTPFVIDGREIVTAASIGVSLAPQDGLDADQLLRNADLALYRSKSEGRGTYRFFEPEMDAALQERRSLEVDLRQALVRNELSLHYQPIVSLRTYDIVGYEALLRWNQPERGSISPALFIPLAEEIGLISSIGKWVLREACKEAASWPDHFRLALNLSPVQFRSEELPQAVAAALAATGLPAHRLELEITETVLLDENDSTLAILHQLRGLGARIALDDFGTGFSSLSYVRSFPFDKIKIDRSFVRDSERPDCIAIIRAVASLAANLHMATTAEGIETAEQLDRVKKVGCTEGQGFFFARPGPPQELVHELATRRWIEPPRLRIAG